MKEFIYGAVDMNSRVEIKDFYLRFSSNGIGAFICPCGEKRWSHYILEVNK